MKQISDKDYTLNNFNHLYFLNKDLFHSKLINLLSILKYSSFYYFLTFTYYS